MAMSRSIELVGREPELERVTGWVELLSSGPAGVVVAGDPGIGKTSVWSAALDRAGQAGALVLATRPVEAELPLGYAGLTDLLVVAAEPLLEELSEPLARALAAALLLRNEPGGADPLAVARGTLAALRALAERGPVVVGIDDVQWLDAASARALAYVARRLGDAPIGFALSRRDGHDDPLELHDALGDRSLELHLGGLSAGALGHLLRTRVDEQTTRRVVLRVHERSGGNPFFALELARAPGAVLPTSLRAVVERRLQELPQAAMPAVELTAVLGSARVADFTDAALDSALSAGVLIEREGEVRFAHPLLAAGSYERLPAGRRRALHRRAAERSSGIEERARHLALATADSDPEVATLLDEAARAAQLRGASEFAVELAAQARRLTHRADVEALAERTLAEAEYLYVAADEPAARARVQEVLASGSRGEVRARALIHGALHASDPEAAVALCEEAVSEQHGDPRLAARAMALLAWQRGAWLGDVEPALFEAVAAVELAEALDDEATLATVLTGAGLICGLAGDPRSERFFRRAVEIADRGRKVAGDREPRSAFAHQLWWRGHFAEAEELLEREGDEALRHGDEGALMRLGVFRGELELRRGDWDEAERSLEGTLEVARDYWRIAALEVRAQVRARRGDPAALGDAAEIAASPFAASDPVIAATADFTVGLVALGAGDAGRAAPGMLRLAGLTKRLGAHAERVLAAIPDTVLALLEAGRAEEADRLTARLEARAAKGDHRWASAAAGLCRGSVLLAAGDVVGAQTLLAESRHVFETIGAQWELAQALLAEGNALRRAGTRTAAGDALERASAIFGELGADPWRRRALDDLRRARPRPRRDDSLTAAESRVAALVAAGRTNREVAAELFTTVATVEAHLTRIYRKLELRSRTELARAVADGRVAFDS
jgi:DNA-binding CsgD family transcriptional regulator